MINYFKIRKNGKFYLLPITTAFGVSKDGIRVLGVPESLLVLKPGDIKPHGVDTVDIVQDLEWEYRRLNRKTEGPVLIEEPKNVAVSEEELKKFKVLNRELKRQLGILKSRDPLNYY